MSRPADRDIQPSVSALAGLRRAFVAIFLLAAIFTGLSLVWSWHSEYRRELTGMSALVDLGESALNSYFRNIERNLAAVAEDIIAADGDIRLDTAELELKRLKTIYPELRIALIARTDGQVILTTDSRRGDNLPSLAAEPSFVIGREELQRGARLSIGRAFLGLVSKEWIIPLRYGVRSRDGTLRYLLGVGLPVASTYAFWKDAPLPAGAALGVVRDDLHVISRHPLPESPDLKSMFSAPQSGALAQHLKQHQFPYRGNLEGHGSLVTGQNLYAFRRLADFPVTIYAVNPLSNVRAAWLANIHTPILLLALSLLAGFLLFHWIRKGELLREASRELRFRLAVDGGGVGTWEQNLETNQLRWSDEFKALLGYAPNELVESHADWTDRLHPDDRTMALAQIADMRSDGSDYRAEMRLRHRDGAYRVFLSRAKVLPVANGANPVLAGAVVDITERRQSEEALRQSEENLAVTLHSIGDAVISTDNQELIVRMNAEAARLTGWPIAEAVGRPLSEVFRIINAHSRQPVENPVKRVLEQGTIVGLASHTALLARDGMEYQIADSAAPIRGKSGQIAGVVLVFRDVSASYRIEQESAALAAIVANSHDAIYSRDLQGAILTWNRGAEQLLGYSAAEIIGKSTRVLVPVNHPSRRSINNKLLLSGGMAARESIRMTKAGKIVAVISSHSPIMDSAGEMTGVSIVLRDVSELKQTRAALQQSEEVSRSTFEHAEVGIAHAAIPTGVLLRVNPAYCRMLGYTAEEMVGRNGREFLHPDDVESREAYLAQVAAGALTVTSIDRRLRKKDGTYLWVHRTTSLVRDPAGAPSFVVVITQDISARKLAEDAQANLAAIVSTANDAIMSRDLNGNVTSWNAGAERLLGYAASEVIGKNIFAVFTPPELMPELLKRQDEIRQGRTVPPFDTVRIAKDGRHVDVSANVTPIKSADGAVLGASIIYRDITLRKRAEAEHARLAEIVESSSDAIFSRNLDGTILTWNAGAEKMLGYTAAEAIGKPVGFTRYAAEEAILTDVNERVLCGEQVNREFRRTTKDGRVITVLGSLSPIKDITGRIVGVSGILRDITDSKRMEADRARLEEQLRESQKMEAIGTLAGGIAHDFNNALATILGNAELARQDAAGNSAALESLAEIRRAGIRARDLVQQILAFSRRQPADRTVLDLYPVVRAAERLLRATLPARIGLDVHCDPDTPTVLANASQIEQLLINLATNAMQAIHGDFGSIQIRLDAVALNEPLVAAHPALQPLHARNAERCVRLTVSDTGMGMDTATRKRIFEPFFTTKPPGEGTGLGLAVVHGIVRGHEGAIIVDSEPGRGTTFGIYLPPAAPVDLPQESASEPVAPGAASGKRVLYLDDDEALVSVVTRTLRRQGIQVEGHGDPAQALARLCANPQEFDLLVSDYNMPGMSGLEVTRAVKALCPRLPVVLISGFIDEALRAQAWDAGVSELFHKADSAEEFSMMVERALKGVIRSH